MKYPYLHHIKHRFKEKFKSVQSCVNNDFTYLRDIDVMEISNIAFTTEGYMTRKGTKNTIKKIIFYNGISMWTVIDPNRNILITVYPVNKTEIKKLYKLTK